MIDQKTVKDIASLARLHMEDAEAAVLAADLESILHYVDQLKTLDVSAVKPTSHVLNMENVFREDVVLPSLSHEASLSFAVDKSGFAYKVPKVIE